MKNLVMILMTSLLLLSCVMSAEKSTHVDCKILKRAGKGQNKIDHGLGGRMMADLVDEFQPEMEDESQFHYAGKHRGIRQLGQGR